MEKIILKNNTPYLSVVATSRNDDHGGNALWRTQHFIDGLAYQAEKFELPTELVLVDWNPPKNKKSLFEALRWPKDRKFFQFRVIEVPAKYHNQFESSQELPLFQYIAKNVGIRRARGEFILSTNIDILFSNELFSYLKKKLNKKFVYRATRYDIEPNIPDALSFDKILDHIKNNIIRVNSKYKTFEYNIYKNRMFLYFILPFYFLIPRISLGILRVLREYCRGISHEKNLLKKLKSATSSLLKMNKISLWREKILFLINTQRKFELCYKQTRLHHKLHTNACGDFTVMSKYNWNKLRGYPEFEMYSWHIDSILLYQAHFMNIPTKILSDKCALYHIEHGKGSGWTPEGAQLLFNRLKEKKIKFLTDDDLTRYYLEGRSSRKNSTPIFYNNENWGGSKVKFQEKSSQ